MVDHFMKGRFQFVDRGAVKHDDIGDAGQPAGKDAVIGIVIDARGIAAISHGCHGVMPACVKNSRTALTRYFKASFSGCGR